MPEAPPPAQAPSGESGVAPAPPGDTESMAAMLKAQAAMLAQMQAQLDQVAAQQELGRGKAVGRESPQLRTEADRRDDVRLKAVRCD